MAEFDGYPAGTPAWVDLGTPDLDGSRRFYGDLFGWQAEDQGPEAGGYTIFTLRGKAVAGCGPLMSDQQPPAWATYVYVDDADTTIKTAEQAGATVLMPPMDVLQAGRMAILMDPTGAVISIWQPREHKGAQLANEANTLCWNELSTRDTKAAEAFYTKVFGWTAETSTAEGMTYTEWKIGDRSIGGMLEMGENFPPQVPANWLAYFAVDDCDATVKKVTDLGGAVMMPARDIPPGRFAVVADPSGAVFAVIKMNAMEADQ